MNANEVVESYVTDVAVLLPRKLRNDVAFELRALLIEGLQDKAESLGRSVDAAMAIEFLRAFGHPADVAGRYRPSLTIIEPSDGSHFLRASVIGLAIIWSLGLLQHLSGPMHSGGNLLLALGAWWGSVVIPSLWWPGVLVAWFGTASWARRRWPQASDWKPRSLDRVQGGRAAIAMGIIGIFCGIALLINPRWILDFFWSGHAAPVAYQALTYTDAFRQREGILLLVLVALNIPLLAAVLVGGRWSPMLRRLEFLLGLATGAVMAWTVAAGPMMMTASSDETARFLIGLIVVFMLLHYGIRHYRAVRPVAESRATT